MNTVEPVNQFLSVTGDVFFERLRELEQHLQSLPNENQIEPPVNHYFAHKTYVREMIAPAESIIIGKTHKHDHICIVLKGRALVYSEHGSFEVVAPSTFVAPKGSKRLFVVLEDLVFQNVHAVETHDLDEIENEVIVPDTQVDEFRKLLKLEV